MTRGSEFWCVSKFHAPENCWTLWSEGGWLGGGIKDLNCKHLLSGHSFSRYSRGPIIWTSKSGLSIIRIQDNRKNTIDSEICLTRSLIAFFSVFWHFPRTSFAPAEMTVF